MSQETIFEVEGFEVYKMDGGVVFNLDESKVDLAEASLSVCRELASQQVELVSLQSLVREYLEAKDKEDDAQTECCNRYNDSDAETWYAALRAAQINLDKAEQALRAALPNLAPSTGEG